MAKVFLALPFTNMAVLSIGNASTFQEFLDFQYITNHKTLLLHHNFTTRSSTVVYECRTLFSIYYYELLVLLYLSVLSLYLVLILLGNMFAGPAFCATLVFWLKLNIIYTWSHLAWCRLPPDKALKGAFQMICFIAHFINVTWYISIIAALNTPKPSNCIYVLNFIVLKLGAMLYNISSNTSKHFQNVTMYFKMCNIKTNENYTAFKTSHPNFQILKFMEIY